MVHLTQPLQRRLRERAINRAGRRGSWAARIRRCETEILLKLVTPRAQRAATSVEYTAETLHEQPAFADNGGRSGVLSPAARIVCHGSSVRARHRAAHYPSSRGKSTDGEYGLSQPK